MMNPPSSSSEQLTTAGSSKVITLTSDLKYRNRYQHLFRLGNIVDSGSSDSFLSSRNILSGTPIQHKESGELKKHTCLSCQLGSANIRLPMPAAPKRPNKQSKSWSLRGRQSSTLNKLPSISTADIKAAAFVIGCSITIVWTYLTERISNLYPAAKSGVQFATTRWNAFLVVLVTAIASVVSQDNSHNGLRRTSSTKFHHRQNVLPTLLLLIITTLTVATALPFSDIVFHTL